MKSTAVFISRLRGLPVLDASGDSVGRVRDVVISLRTLERAPRVKGLVVDIFGRRRIFVPMVRVHSIDPNQVAISAQVDTRQFRRWESEILVIADLFDRTVQRPAGPAVIYDVAMAPRAPANGSSPTPPCGRAARSAGSACAAVRASSCPGTRYPPSC